MTTLSDRARAIETWAETHFVDARGIVYSFLDRATAAPLTDAFFGEEAEPCRVESYTQAEFWSYENCGMTTGAYLQAMVARYAVTGDPTALERARRCYRALRDIYEMGKQLEEGFFPKIYGNRFSSQTSSDQVLYAVLGLDRYAPFATDAERRDIAAMIGKMIGFWVKRDYKCTYFSKIDMPWKLARFPSLLLLAYKHTGDIAFKTEYERLLALGVNRRPGEEQLRPKQAGEVPPSDYERKHGAWLLSVGFTCAAMDLMELDYLLRNDPNNEWADAWRKSALQMWNEGALSVGPDGKAYLHVLIDMKTGATRPPPANLSEAGGLGLGIKMGWSAMVAVAGVLAAPNAPDPRPIIEETQRILTALDIPDLTYMEQPEWLVPSQRYKTRFYSGDAMTNWLWAYWQGRADQLW